MAAPILVSVSAWEGSASEVRVGTRAEVVIGDHQGQRGVVTSFTKDGAQYLYTLDTVTSVAFPAEFLKFRNEGYCPAGHILGSDVSQRHTCDQCHKHIDEGATMKSCRLCDFDLCPVCASQPAAPTPRVWSCLGCNFDNELSTDTCPGCCRRRSAEASLTGALAEEFQQSLAETGLALSRWADGYRPCQINRASLQPAEHCSDDSPEIPRTSTPPASEAESQVWSCPKCTLNNELTTEVCAACEHRRNSEAPASLEPRSWASPHMSAGGIVAAPPVYHAPVSFLPPVIHTHAPVTYSSPTAYRYEHCATDYQTLESVSLYIAPTGSFPVATPLLMEMPQLEQDQGSRAASTQASASSDDTPHVDRSKSKQPVTSGDCVICLSSTATHVIVPCGHQCICAECSEALDGRCPLCRGNVQCSVKVYVAGA